MKVNFFRVTTGTMFATIATASSLRQSLDRANMAETAMPDELAMYLSQVGSTAETEDFLLGSTTPMMPFDWGFDSIDQHLLAQTDNMAEAIWKRPKEIALKPTKIKPVPMKKPYVAAKGAALKAQQQKVAAKQKLIGQLKTKLTKVTGKAKVKLQNDIKKNQASLGTMKKQLASMTAKTKEAAKKEAIKNGQSPKAAKNAVPKNPPKPSKPVQTPIAKDKLQLLNKKKELEAKTNKLATLKKTGESQ